MELAIELDGHVDRRTVQGESCEALVEALELLVTVRRDEVDDGIVAAPQASKSTARQAQSELPATRNDEVRSSKPIAGPVSRQQRKQRSRAFGTGLMLGAAGGLGLGRTPFPAVPVELAVGWSWPWFRLAARGRYLVPRRSSAIEEASALIQMGTAGVEGCARLGVGRAEFPLCAQVAGGGSRADGRGSAPRTRAGLWAETGVDAGFAWHFSPRWALTFRAGAAVVLAKTRYTDRDRVIFDSTPVVGHALFGVQTHVPIQLGRKPENTQ